MPDEPSLSPWDKTALAFFEIAAFALGWNGIDRLLAGDSMLIVIPIFAATILTSYTGFNWPKIREKIGVRVGRVIYTAVVLGVLVVIARAVYNRYSLNVDAPIADSEPGNYLRG